MRLLMITRELLPTATVSSYRMTELAEFLLTKDIEVTVIRMNPKIAGNILDNVKIDKRIKIYFVEKESNLFKTANLYKKKVIEVLNKNKFDIILSSCGPYYSELFLPKISKKYNIPYILDFRDLWIQTYNNLKKKDKIFCLVKKIIEKSAIKYAEGIVTVVPGDKKELIDNYNLNDEDIKVIFNGFNDNKLKFTKKINLNIDLAYNNIGVFGKLSYYAPELIDDLFITIDRLNKQGYNFRLFHIGDEETYINKRIKFLDLDPDIYFYAGYMEYEKGIQYLQNMICNLLVYIHPVGLGTKIFDYIYVNKPVVVFGNSNSYLSEFVKTFQGGFICNNKEQLEIYLKMIIDNKNNILCEEIIKEKYGRSHQNLEYYKFINKILKK